MHLKDRIPYNFYKFSIQGGTDKAAYLLWGDPLVQNMNKME